MTAVGHRSGVERNRVRVLEKSERLRALRVLDWRLKACQSVPRKRMEKEVLNP